MRVLKHFRTRWLSPECFTDCLLLLWHTLHTYFDHELDTGNDRVRRDAHKLESFEARLYVTFVSFSLKPLYMFNTAFQMTTSKIGIIQADVLTFPRPTLLILMSSVTQTTCCRSALKTKHVQLDNPTLSSVLAPQPGCVLINAKEDSSADWEQRFFKNVRLIYKSTAKKVITKCTCHLSCPKYLLPLQVCLIKIRQ